MNTDEVKQMIVNEDGFGIVTNGYWFRTDFDIEGRTATLRSGQDMMPPHSETAYDVDSESDMERLAKHMIDIAPLDSWLTFDEFYTEE